MAQMLHVLVRQYLAFGRGLREGQEASAQKKGCPKPALSKHKARDSLFSFLGNQCLTFYLNLY